LTRQLYHDHRGIGAICYEEKGKSVVDGDKNYKVSLRAVLDEDTTVIAKCYGGGGHKDASSFILPRDEWATWKTTTAD
jgi:nanoRNase/pAp phosphatase (c-di-AMP/oligoRNAs hydrolase)